MDIIAVFSNNLKNIRKQKNITQEELAWRCGLHRTYISAVERGKRSISLINIQKIANALDVNYFELFKEWLNVRKY